MSTLLIVAFLARASSSSDTLLATACTQGAFVSASKLSDWRLVTLLSSGLTAQDCRHVAGDTTNNITCNLPCIKPPPAVRFVSINKLSEWHLVTLLSSGCMTARSLNTWLAM